MSTKTATTSTTPSPLSKEVQGAYLKLFPGSVPPKPPLKLQMESYRLLLSLIQNEGLVDRPAGARTYEMIQADLDHQFDAFGRPRAGIPDMDLALQMEAGFTAVREFNRARRAVPRFLRLKIHRVFILIRPDGLEVGGTFSRV